MSAPRGQPLQPATPHESPALWAPRLARVLDRQRDLYLRLDALSRTQADAIHAEDTDGLLSILAQRQALIDDIAALNEDLAPFVDRWDDLAPRLSPEQRAPLRARFDEVAQLVKEIADRDDADRRVLESRRAVVAAELNSLSSARGAVRAYAGADRGAPSPRYQDRTG